FVDAGKCFHCGGLYRLRLAEVEQTPGEILNVREGSKAERANRGHPVRDGAFLVGGGRKGVAEQVIEHGLGLTPAVPGEVGSAGRRQLRRQVADEIPEQRLLAFGKRREALNESGQLVLAVRVANERRQLAQQLAAMSGGTVILVFE